MLRYLNFDIVFQEVPDEITLAINLSNCPFRCKGCHSPYLQEDKGEELTEEALEKMIEKYGSSLTCIGFMGGDADPEEVERLSVWVKKRSEGRLKTAWYSGRTNLPEKCSPSDFDFIKLGPYVENLGGLDSPTGNQRFYKITSGEMQDITPVFVKKKRKE